MLCIQKNSVYVLLFNCVHTWTHDSVCGKCYYWLLFISVFLNPNPNCSVYHFDLYLDSNLILDWDHCSVLHLGHCWDFCLHYHLDGRKVPIGGLHWVDTLVLDWDHCSVYHFDFLYLDSNLILDWDHCLGLHLGHCWDFCLHAY
jgi:hypothetical protein